MLAAGPYSLTTDIADLGASYETDDSNKAAWSYYSNTKTITGKATSSSGCSTTNNSTTLTLKNDYAYPAVLSFNYKINSTSYVTASVDGTGSTNTTDAAFNKKTRTW